MAHLMPCNASGDFVRPQLTFAALHWLHPLAHRWKAVRRAASYDAGQAWEVDDVRASKSLQIA